MRRSKVSAPTTRKGGGGGVLESCFEILKVDVFKKEVVMCH